MNGLTPHLEVVRSSPKSRGSLFLPKLPALTDQLAFMLSEVSPSQNSVSKYDEGQFGNIIQEWLLNSDQDMN